MIWALTTTETWSAEKPDIGYNIVLCDGEIPDKFDKVEELLNQNPGLQLVRWFHAAEEAKQFVSGHSLRLLGPIPSADRASSASGVWGHLTPGGSEALTPVFWSIGSNRTGNWNKIVIRRVFPGLRAEIGLFRSDFRPYSTYKLTSATRSHRESAPLPNRLGHGRRRLRRTRLRGDTGVAGSRAAGRLVYCCYWVPCRWRTSWQSAS